MEKSENATVKRNCGQIQKAVKSYDLLHERHIKDAGTEVVKAKNGKGSATLSMGYAGARLDVLLRGGFDGDDRALQ